jgi:hypothetical protein
MKEIRAFDKFNLIESMRRILILKKMIRLKLKIMDIIRKMNKANKTLEIVLLEILLNEINYRLKNERLEKSNFMYKENINKSKGESDFIRVELKMQMGEHMMVT